MKNITLKKKNALLLLIPMQLFFSLPAQVVNGSAPEKATIKHHTGGSSHVVAEEKKEEQLQFGTHKQSAEGSIAWIKPATTTRSLSFVENLGQFDKVDGINANEILYGVKDNATRVFFTKQGLVYKTLKNEKVSDIEWEAYVKKNHLKSNEPAKEESEDHRIIKESYVHMNWEGANPSVKVVAESPLSNYFNYLNYQEMNKSKAIIGNARGFQKITYTNIYPNIDIEYTIHAEGGIKYALILHPGADPSLIKMNYTGTIPTLDAEKNILLTTPCGNITDHAPSTFVGSVQGGEKISSAFAIIGQNTIGFNLASENIPLTRTLIIDPVTNFAGTVAQCADDIATDPNDNVLVYLVDTSGTNGSSLQKWNSAGTLQWTLDLIGNLDYSQFFQGDVGADNSDNEYITIGLGVYSGGYYNTCKINPTGTSLLFGLLAPGAPGGSTNNLYETWSISFNCDQTQLIQSGGGLYNGGVGVNGVYFNVSTYETLNTATGAEGTIVRDDNLGEIIASLWAPNNMMYHLTADSNLNGSLSPPSPYTAYGNYGRLICDNPSTGFSRVFNVPTHYHYMDANKKAPGSIGMNGIATSCTYLYTTDGLKLDQWDLNTGAHLGTTNVTGGNNAGFNNIPTNSGIICDKCGNVYVGSNQNIYVFDPNLNPISTISGFPDRIFDLSLGKNGLIYACGGTATATSFVASVNNVCSSATGGLTVNVTQPTCATPSGSASATVTFCGAPYIYSWSNGTSNPTVSGLTPGSYSVTVSGSVTCPFTYSVTGSFTVNPAPGTPTATPAGTNVTCNGACNGIAQVNPSGGTTPYTFAWTGTAQTTNPATALCPGTYTCTITGNNGCSTTQPVVITQPAVLAITPTQTNLNCNGAATGIAGVTPVSGGNGGYTYAWTGAPAAGQTTATVNNLPAGTYVCTVTDVLGCTATHSFTITQPAALSLTPGALTNATCGASNGSACVNASGGTGAYTYAWSGAGGNASCANNLGAGSYVCTVTDNLGCVQTYTATIVSPGSPTATNVPTSNVCNGTCTGKIVVTASGGTGLLTYSWTPNSSAVDSATGLCAGTYTCIITDGSGCTNNQVVTLTDPAVIASTPTSTPAVCGQTNGSAAAPGTGGTGPLTYTWTGPGSPFTIAQGQTTANLTGLGQGLYTCTIADGNGCSKQFTVNVNNSGGPSGTVAVTNPACSGGCNGTATVTASAGLAPYTYAWSQDATNHTNTAGSLCAGIYTCSVTDANSCVYNVIDTIKTPPALNVAATNNNTSCSGVCDGKAFANTSGGTAPYTFAWVGNASTTDSAVALCSGPYTCNITDASGCTTSQVFNITQPAPLTVSTAPKNVTCTGASDGTACATGAGGTLGSGYTYSWTPAPVTGGTTSCASALPPGTYTVTITDQNGCTTNQQITISQPAPLTSAAVAVNTTCQAANGTATATPSGGRLPYTFSWNPSAQTTATATNLVAGTYTCTVTDSSGCTSVITDTVNNTGSMPVAAIITPHPLTFCAGDSALLTASGSFGGTYSWSTGSTADSIYVHNTQTVTLTATNVCGTSTATDAITVYSVPVPVVTGMNIFCPNTNDTLNVTSTPATVPPTTFVWTPGGSGGSSLIVTTAGNYTVTASNPCGSTQSVFNASTYNIVAEFTSDVNAGENPLPVAFKDSSTATAITWNWNFGDGGTGSGIAPNHTFLNAGTYIVTETITDVHGCKSMDTMLIRVSETPSYLTPPNVFTPNDDGDNDYWQVHYRAIATFDAKIYDRWGVMMTELFAPNQGWDGRTSGGLPAVAGTYYWIIKAKGDDGKVYDLTGFLMLIRH